MQMKRFLILVSLTAFCTCTNHEKHACNRKEITRIVPGQEMIVKHLQGYGIIGAYGDYLFLKEKRDTSRLVVYHVAGDSLTYFKGLINRGRGPFEFYYTEYSFGEDSLFVSNSDPAGIRAIYGIPLQDMSRIDDVSTWKKYPFREKDLQTGLSFAPYGKGRFIVMCGKPDTQEIFSLTDFNGKGRIPLRFWPDDPTPGPLHSKQMVYMQSSLCSRSDRIAYASLNARYMFLASVAGEELITTAAIYPRLPQYQIKPDGNLRFSEDGEYGILLRSTPDYVYAQVGRTVSEVNSADNYKGYPDYFVDEIEVYDWNGRFVDNYQTDRPFYSFAVSEDNRYLYTLTLAPDTSEPILMRYEFSMSRTANFHY